MNHVLGAIDDSPCGPAVLGAVRALAELFDATPIALHVREDGSDRVVRAAKDAGVELRILAGSVIETIIAVAEQPDMLAVVLGARGTHIGARPVGHTALQVITSVEKPVVVVPPERAPDAAIARLLLPLDGTESSSQATAATALLAHSRGLRIHVLHVHHPEAMPAFEDQLHYAVPVWEREFAARFVGIPSADVEIIRRVGVAAEQVGAVAAEVQADLIVLGWRRNLSPGRAQVVRETLAHSRVPVMLVPAS